MYFYMAAQPRYSILYDYCTFHITWQCHNKEWLLADVSGKAHYIHLIKKYAQQYRVKIYSFTLMSNHPHITGICENARLLSDFFRVVNSVFAKAYNRKNNRRGQVVMDRFKSPVIETDADLINVMLYIDMNPVRARMVKHPKQHHWSSHKFYASGKFPPWITPAPAYLKLGKTAFRRAKAYRKLIEKLLRNPWEKRPYTTIKFIGSKNWVMLKTKQLRSANRKRRLEWLENYKLKFGHPPKSQANPKNATQTSTVNQFNPVTP